MGNRRRLRIRASRGRSKRCRPPHPKNSSEPGSQASGVRLLSDRMRPTATPPCSERLRHHALSPEPLELRVGDRGSAPGRVQAEPVRHARPSAHHPAPHGGGHGPAPTRSRGIPRSDRTGLAGWSRRRRAPTRHRPGWGCEKSRDDPLRRAASSTPPAAGCEVRLWQVKWPFTLPTRKRDMSIPARLSHVLGVSLNGCVAVHNMQLRAFSPFLDRLSLAPIPAARALGSRLAHQSRRVFSCALSDSSSSCPSCSWPPAVPVRRDRGRLAPNPHRPRLLRRCPRRPPPRRAPCS